MATVLLRCKKCRRPFASSADVCPDCGKRSPRGQRNYVIKIASVVVTFVALATTLVLAVSAHRSRDPKGEAHSIAPLSPPQDQTGSDVSFNPP